MIALTITKATNNNNSPHNFQQNFKLSLKIVECAKI